MAKAWSERVKHPLMSVGCFLTGTTTDRYIKISLFSSAIYIVCIVALLATNTLFFNLLETAQLSSWCGLNWIGTSPSPSPCLRLLEIMDSAYIPVMLGIVVLAYGVAMPTGLFAAYKAIKTHHKWWAAITIYAVVQAVPIFYFLVVPFIGE